MSKARQQANLSSDGNLFADISNDRVGIGSVVPTHKLHVAGTSKFDNDVKFEGTTAALNIDWDKSANTLNFSDNTKLTFGDATNGDFGIYHDASNSYLHRIAGGTGDIYVKLGGDNAIVAKTDNSVELYWDNSKKFETLNTGAKVTGNLEVTGVLTYDDVTSIDSVGIVTARAGITLTGGVIKHTGQLKLIAPAGNSVRIRNHDDSDNVAVFNIDDSTHLYYNSAHKFSTVSDGIDVLGNILMMDSLTHRGDTNTKIRFPADDTVTVETAGSERLRIQANGSVGIGTDDASWGLSGAGGLVVGDGSGSQSITLFGTNNGDISFGDAKSGSARYSGLIRYNHTDDYMAFRTGTQERFRIKSNGNVGIAETNPQALLHLNAGANSTIMFGNTTHGYKIRANVSGSNDYGLLIEDEDGVDLYRVIASTGTTNANTHIFSTAGSERLNISNSVISAVGIVMKANTGFVSDTNLIFNSDNNANNGTNDSIIFKNAGTERVRIKGNGNTGIGTASPQERLHLYGGNCALEVDAPADRYCAVGFSVDGASKWWMGRGDSDILSETSFFIGRDAGNATDKGGNSAEFVIKSNGDVEWHDIGTATPGEGNNTVGMGFEPRNGTIFLSRGSNALIVSNRNNDGRHIHFNQGGTGKFAIGLQNSGADLAFFSGSGNSPTERLRITSTGHTRIENDVNALADLSTAANYHLHLSNPANDAGEAVGICFGLSTGRDIGASIYHTRSGGTSYGDLMFATKPSSGGAVTERLRITSSGKVGIKTDNPSEMLQVGDGSGTTGGLKVAGQSSSVTDDGLTIDWTGSNEARLFSESSGNSTMKFYTTSSGTRGLRHFIQSNGNTDIYASQVHLYNSVDTSNTYFYAQNTGAGNAGIKMKNNQGEWTIIANDRLRFIDDDASTERLSIDSSGRLGLGQATPVSKLHISETGSNTINIQLTNATTGHTHGSDGMTIGYSSNSSVGFINVAEGSSGFLIKTGGTASGNERLRIDSSGRVGINETSPGTHLHVEQDNAHSSTYYLNSDAAILVDNKNASGRSVIKLEHDAALVYGAGSQSLIISDRQNERLRILSTGGLTFNGDTATANALDDYEEGSWSPAFKAQNNSTACPTNVNEAKYTKIGRLVVATAYFTMSSYASGTTGGYTLIVGLPYTNIGEHGGVSINYWNSLKQNVSFMAGTVQGSSSDILIRATTATAASTQNIDFDNTFGPSDSLILTATYFTS